MTQSRKLASSSPAEFTEAQSIAWVRLMAQAKRSPVIVRFHGLNDKDMWLWSVTNELGETLALQGNEFQVIDSMHNW